MEGYLLKNSGGKKVVPSAGGAGRGKRASMGNLRGKWERRYFVLTEAGELRYYRKSADVQAGKPPSGVLQCSSGLVQVEEREGTFKFETKERVLALRAETDVERSGWVVALLAAGAQDHPLASHLAAHPSAPSAPSPLAVARAGSARTYVPVPEGLRPGQRFQVEVPTGERFNVTVPVGAAEQIEVLVPARCTRRSTSCSSQDLTTTAPASSAPNANARHPPARTTGAGAGAGTRTGTGAGTDPDTAWTLCRRFELRVPKPAGARLGLALAPSRAGHLTVTDITPGGLAATLGVLQLGDMLVAMNGSSLSDLESFVSRISAMGACEVTFEVQRVEDENALQLLLEQVSSEQHRIELEQRSRSLEQVQSQEDTAVKVAMEESLSLLRAESSQLGRSGRADDISDPTEDEELRHAIAASLQSTNEGSSAAQQAEAATEAATEAAMELSRRLSLDEQQRREQAEAQEAAMLAEAIRASQEDTDDALPAELAHLAPVNPVRELEMTISRAEGMPAVETAAAARSRAASAMPTPVPTPTPSAENSIEAGAERSMDANSLWLAVDPTVSPPPPPTYGESAGGGGGGGGGMGYRTESIRRCYEAQHQFVLAQLTAPGVDAFLIDDESASDEEDEGGADEGGGGGSSLASRSNSGLHSRSNSKFV